jgi:hypothetical protein
MKRLILLLPMLFALLHGIVCIAGDGTVIPQDRQFHYSYHNSTNDYNIYGSNKWAVKFNFRNAYPSVAQVAFNVSGARLWFPNVGDSVTVELFTDLAGQPGTMISSKRVAVSQNQVDVLFDEASTHELVWLVVGYNTNMNNRFVSASAGGGTRSYFMNQVGDQQYLSSLALAGFDCELLFGVLGDFVLAEADLQLLSFNLLGNLEPGSRAYPSFSIYNHSDVAVNSASLRIYLSKPGFAQYDTLYIDIPQAVAAHSQYDFDAEGLFLDLPEQPTQFRLDMRLESEFAENDTLFANNSLSQTYNLFTEPMSVKVVENFIREAETAPLAALQAPHLTADTHVFQYFPVLSDSLSNLASIRRFNWYGFNSIPRTVGNGELRIIGLTPAYEESFGDLMESMAEHRTFISSSSCRLDSIPQSENVALTVSLTNQQTAMYTGLTQSLMSNSCFFAGLFAQSAGEETERFVLQRWITFADTINTAIGLGSTVEKRYVISASGLFDESQNLRYRVYYWIQGNNGSRIHYAGYQGFEPGTYSNNADAHAPRVEFGLHPNPLRKGNTLKVTLDDTRLPSRIKIYNIRGQLVHAQSDIRKEAELDVSIFPGSGIYFIRVEQGGKPAQTKKFSIIK